MIMELDHRIFKYDKDCELFEKLFEIDIIERKETSLVREDIKIIGNYFRSDIVCWYYKDCKELDTKVNLFNISSKEKSCYIMSYFDAENDGDRIIKSSFSIGVYDKKSENLLFKNKELAKIIFYGQNFNKVEKDFDLYMRKRKINQIKSNHL